MQFSANFMENTLFWTHFGLRAASGVKTLLAPLTKILDPPWQGSLIRGQFSENMPNKVFWILEAPLQISDFQEL